MLSPSSRSSTRGVCALALAALLLLCPAEAAAFGSEAASDAQRSPDSQPTWLWPVDGTREVAEPFLAPAHDYGPGHRGVDIVAGTGTTVRAPADGVVAFQGVVVDRPLLTLDHGGGFVSTFEPVASTLTPGTAVQAGDEIGTVATGGHTGAGHLHIGVRLNGRYINPMLMFGDVPRAVLLPCCGPVMRAGEPVGRSL